MQTTFPLCPITAKRSYSDRKSIPAEHRLLPAGKRKNRLRRLRAYQCDYCPYIHLTSGS